MILDNKLTTILNTSKGIALKSMIVTLLFSIYPKNCLRIVSKSSVLNALPSLFCGEVINFNLLSESFVSSLVINLSNSPLYAPFEAFVYIAVLVDAKIMSFSKYKTSAFSMTLPSFFFGR